MLLPRNNLILNQLDIFNRVVFGFQQALSRQVGQVVHSDTLKALGVILLGSIASNAESCAQIEDWEVCEALDAELVVGCEGLILGAGGCQVLSR